MLVGRAGYLAGALWLQQTLQTQVGKSKAWETCLIVNLEVVAIGMHSLDGGCH